VTVSAAQAPFEVFVKERPDGSFEHVGSVRAANAEFALEWAKEVYTRRSDAHGLWIVPRECITALPPSQHVLFRSGYEREYRRTGYFSRRRRELTRQVQGEDTFEDVIDMEAGDGTKG
jgi:ring-1,2-phenylacetyl-CoA epoxidase subunit PaaB